MTGVQTCALPISVRSDCEIFIKEEIMNIVGMDQQTISTDNPETEETENVDAELLTPDELDLLTLEDLEELLNLAITEEKYELAVNLRDAIKKKKTA